jgi:hypothetical protein
LSGPVVSDPTLWRTLKTIDGHDLTRIVAARAKTRTSVWGADRRPSRRDPARMPWRAPPTCRSTPAGAAWGRGRSRHGKLERVRPLVGEIVDRLLTWAQQLGPPAELMSAFAYPLPIAVLCALLGIPEVDRTDFVSWVDTMLSEEFGSAERGQAAGTLVEYAKRLAADKHARSAGDLHSTPPED